MGLPDTTRKEMLTKTTYLTYTQCPKAFWLNEFQPHLAAPPDEAAQRRLRAAIEHDYADDH